MPESIIHCRTHTTGSATTPSGFTLGMLCLLLLLCPFPVLAQDQDVPLEFDIYTSGDSLSIWVDLSPTLTSSSLARLKDGIDLGLECRFRLKRPRRLFGTEEVASRSLGFTVSYRVLTDRFVVYRPRPDSTHEIPFTSLGRLYAYLADSVFTTIIPMDSLDNQSHYIADVGVTAISLGGINIAPESEEQTAPASPLRTLFNQFLRLSGYGREDYQVESRPFSPRELSPTR